jgi:replicative DNA helicase
MNGARLPPHDIAAEECVIGSLLIAGEQMVNIDKLKSSDFYHEVLGILFSACKTLWDRKQPINEITMAEELERQNNLETIGGVAYLMHLQTLVPSPLEIESYADIVRRLSVSRKAIILGEKITDIGYQADYDQQKVISKITDLVSDFRKHHGKFAGLVSPRDAAEMVFSMLTKYSNHQKRISWGFRVLDNITSGIYPSELIITGARPSIGKTQFMLDVAEYVEAQGYKVLFVSAEMSIEHLLERKVARILRKSVLSLRKGQFTEEETDQLVNYTGIISEGNIYTLAANVSSHDIYAEASRLKEQVDIDIVFVDYLQKLTDCYGERENQNVRVSRVSKVLKDISSDLNIPVVVASQLSRELENRPEKEQTPKLSDLRDSGSIEQDADVVLLLHRYMGPSPVYDKGNKDPNVLKIKMAKNRQLGTAPVQKIYWDSNNHRYINFDSEEQETLL